jgi:ABC-type thiamin/hydroxymethylpyrimidine transport system permease subunit
MAAVVAVETPAYPQQAVLEEVVAGAIKAAYLGQQDREMLVATLLV